MLVFQRTRTPDLPPITANLRRVCWFRGILVSIECLCLLLAIQLFHIELPIYGLSLVFLFNILIIAFTLWRLQCLPRPVSNQEFFLQLLMDVIGLALFLFLTGGYTNPMVSLLLIPASLCAALLPERYSWSLTLTAIIAYSLLMKWYIPLTPPLKAPLKIGIEHSLTGNSQQMISMHLLGMWVTFVFSVLLINYFVVRMALALRNQQAAIAVSRERQLRDENILAIAIQAAGAAHELGTPLATMTVLLGDMKEEHAPNKELTEDLHILQTQISKCKQRLKHLINESQNTETEQISVTDFMCHTLDQWQLLRPDIPLIYTQPDWPVSPDIRCDPSLYQAMIALLDNAADASPDFVQVSLVLEKYQVIIRIDDQGTGIPVAMAEQLGTVIYNPQSSCKEAGLGLGLLLSQASIERQGGQVQLYNRPPSGTRTEIHLPIGQNL